MINQATVKMLQEILGKQKTKYTKNEEVSLLGATPTLTGETKGDYEVQQLKEIGRGSTGSVILSQYQNATGVTAITENGAPSDLWDWWETERMPQKLRMLARDRKVGAVGFILAEMQDDGTVKPLIMSPKDTCVSSTDLANNEWVDNAGRYYKATPPDATVEAEYWRVWDDTEVTLFTRAAGGVGDFVEVEGARKPHGATRVPIVPFFDMMFSDGNSHSLIEMIGPAIENERIMLSQLNKLAWFNAVKPLFFLGLADEDIKLDPETGGYTEDTLARMERAIQTGPGKWNRVPQAANPDVLPQIVQLSEGNLSQMIELAGFLRDRIASLSSMPISVFQAGSYGQSSEASEQEWRLFETAIEADNLVMSYDLQSLFTLYDEIMGIERTTRPLITWKPANPASLLLQGDTASKLKATGLPTDWIAKNALTGFTPQQIQDLLTALGNEAATPGGLDTGTDNTIDLSDTLGG